MATSSSLRVSDADREAAAERLRHAAVEGRLEPDELEERLHAALRARTYGDLRRLLVDLPAKPLAWERGRAELMPAARTAVAVAMRVAIALAVVVVVLIVAAVMAAQAQLQQMRALPPGVARQPVPPNAPGLPGTGPPKGEATHAEGTGQYL